MNANILDFEYFYNSITDDVQMENTLCYKEITIESDVQQGYNHVSFELLPINKITSLVEYAEYKINLLRESNKTDTEAYDWYNRVYLACQHLLNFDNENSCVTPRYIVNKVVYTPARSFEIEKGKYHSIGRLYGKSSVQTLPRECRQFLFGGDSYVDFDIVNAHPTILLKYATKNDIPCDTLMKYVNNRDLFLQELADSGVKDPKTSVLRHLNLTLYKFNRYGDYNNKMLTDLFYQILDIREVIWKEYAIKDEYARYLKSTGKDIDNQKVTLQAIYCQTQETLHVLNFIEYIKTEFRVLANEPDHDIYLAKMAHFQYMTKELILDLDCHLIAIPFFDGVLVKSLLPSISPYLSSLCDGYNDRYADGVVFKSKTIGDEYEKLVIEELKDVSNLMFLLNNASHLELSKLYNVIPLDQEDKFESITTLSAESLKNVVSRRKFKMYRSVLALKLPKHSTLSDIIEKLHRDQNPE